MSEARIIRPRHEQLNELRGEWERHEWHGLYWALLMDLGYEPENHLLYFDPPGKWRIVERAKTQEGGQA